ncbi:hypothetical protein A3860_14525 [Niastella vici]|uniref:Uncharacterized protein n=1 Tax=Niastella vici TaxID=1703345 RepID=A0A1V9G5G1_9BACT|nr:hypothetical protein [Niastella vici]OQP65810.1 hypothetical protein A3860_14525 [Niastella vici]
MAKGKKRAKQHLQKRMVLVRSKRYGDHERNPRGTFTPAVLNEDMVASKNRLLQVNQTASLIFSSIRDNHNDGSLWTRLLSLLRRQLKEKNFNDVHCLLNLECHAVHTLSNILRTYVFVKVAPIVDNQLHISVCIDKAPRWRTKHLNGFLLSVHVIYPDLALNRIEKEVLKSDVLSIIGYPKDVSFVIPVPAYASAYAVFLRITGCINGEPTNGLQSTGMRCVTSGNIERKAKKEADCGVAEKVLKPKQEKSKRKIPQKARKKIKRKGS